jgi:hypothetical protein
MPEPVSLTRAAHATLNAAVGDGTAVSHEADTVRRLASVTMESMEESIALFGRKDPAISEIWALVSEHSTSNWNGEGALPVSAISAQAVQAFIRALPGDAPLPELAADPDGSISLDWIESRNRVFTVSIGTSDRLAYAWLDGTDRGHAVARFDGERIPMRILDGIRETMGHAAIRVA